MQTYYSNTKTLINYSQTPLIWALVGKGGGGGLRGSKEVSVLGGLNLGKLQGLSFTRGNATGP